MTGTREHTFESEDLPCPDVTINLDWEYTYVPAILNRLPEDCCPDEEDHSITPEKGWQDRVRAAYAMAAEQAIKQIELDLIPQLLWEDKPKQWAEEAS